MKRVLVLGRGGAGKSFFARRLGAIADLKVVELDKHFWQADLSPIESEEWAAIQQELIQSDAWVIDGDLGSNDLALEARVTISVPAGNGSLPLCTTAGLYAEYSQGTPLSAGQLSREHFATADFDAVVTEVTGLNT